MSFEQKRNAERLPLDQPLEGTASGAPVKIVEMSAIGCRIEHPDKMSIGGSIVLRFTWNGKPVEVRGKVARTQLRSAYPQGMYYETGLKFADALEEAPEQLRELMASVTAPVADKVSTAEVPPIEMPPASTPGEDTLRRLRLKTERESSLPLEAFAPIDEPIGYDFIEAETPPQASNPFASQAEAVALAIEPEPEAEAEAEIEPEPAPEPAIEVPEPDYVECRLENGTWHRRIVHALLQPDEGFVTLPADERELDMLCKSYAYADPETRRLIRISLELAATK